jgi:hypothetical protein
MAELLFASFVFSALLCLFARTGPSARSKRRRLLLESLETRLAPALRMWDGGRGGGHLLGHPG